MTVMASQDALSDALNDFLLPPASEQHIAAQHSTSHHSTVLHAAVLGLCWLARDCTVLHTLLSIKLRVVLTACQVLLMLCSPFMVELCCL
jgi:hypothetical protein